MIHLWRSLAWRVLLAFGLVAGPWPMVIAAPQPEPVALEQAQVPCHEEAQTQAMPDCCDDAGCVGDACGSALCSLVTGVAPPVVPALTESLRIPVVEALVPEARALHPPPAQRLRPPIA